MGRDRDHLHLLVIGCFVGHGLIIALLHGYIGRMVATMVIRIEMPPRVRGNVCAALIADVVLLLRCHEVT